MSNDVGFYISAFPDCDKATWYVGTTNYTTQVNQVESKKRSHVGRFAADKQVQLF